MPLKYPLLLFALKNNRDVYSLASLRTICHQTKSLQFAGRYFVFTLFAA